MHSQCYLMQANLAPPVTISSGSDVFCHSMCMSYPHFHVNGLSGLAHSHHLLITPKIRSDLEWWLHVLPRYNGVSLIPPPTFTPHILVTDACYMYDGVGGHFGNYRFHGQFPTEIHDMYDFYINIKELLAIIVALRLWGPNMTGQCLLLRSDSQDDILALNNRRSCSPLIQQHLPVIWFLCATFDLDIQAEPIPGYINVIADLLSRGYSDVNAKSKFFELPGSTDYNFQECTPALFNFTFDFSSLTGIN